jgi:hypothetical protein
MGDIPGAVGKLAETYFGCLPGVDAGLAVGGALCVMDRAAEGRCGIRAPLLGPLSAKNPAEPELWKQFALTIAPVARNQQVESFIRGLNAFLEAVVPEASLTSRTVFPEPIVLALYARGFGPSVAAAPTPPSDLVEYVRRIWFSEARYLPVRMNAPALEHAVDQANRWSREDLGLVGERIARTTAVAALIALGVDFVRPLITADILVIANRIGVGDHEEACRIASWVEAERNKVVPLRPRTPGTPPTSA